MSYAPIITKYNYNLQQKWQKKLLLISKILLILTNTVTFLQKNLQNLPVFLSKGIIYNNYEVKILLTMLKTLRKKNRITQRNLADALHISQTSVSKYERGESEPDLDMIIKMADFFGVTIDEFVRGKK